MIKETEIKELGDKIIKAISTIYDPEIPVNIYELGLIYDVEISEDNDVRIEMTLTSPNCPVAESLPVDVENKVKEIDSIENVKVNIVFEPPWMIGIMFTTSPDFRWVLLPARAEESTPLTAINKFFPLKSGVFSGFFEIRWDIISEIVSMFWVIFNESVWKDFLAPPMKLTVIIMIHYFW